MKHIILKNGDVIAVCKDKDVADMYVKFLEENGGNVKKVLGMDKEVKTQAEEIMSKFGNKSLKEATLEEIHEAFKKAKGTEALEKIYTIFLLNMLIMECQQYVQLMEIFIRYQIKIK